MAGPAPGFVTGTSSEYLGARPLRRILRERALVVILGPRGSGKTSVARRVAQQTSERTLYLDTAALQDEVLRRTRTTAWSERVLEVPVLVLDGPVFLANRPAVCGFLRDLIQARLLAGRRTVVCEVAQDGSMDRLMVGVPAGRMATVGLRFPASRSGRMRFARRCCDELGLPRSAAQGTDALEPWGYDRVIEDLKSRLEASA